VDSKLLLIIAGVAVAFGLFTHQGIVTWLGLMFVVLERIAHYWAEFSLADISYSRELSASRVFVGDEFRVTVTVENDKPLPVTWLLAEEDMAHAFDEAPNLVRRYGTDRDVARHSFSLRWFERIRREVVFRAFVRGVHDFGAVTLQSGDPFGFHEKVTSLDLHEEIVVYPETRPLESWEISDTALMGMLSTRRLLVEDPLNIVASREYRAGDPLRQVNWKASARRGHLMTNVIQPTTEGNVALTLNVRTYEHVWEGSNYDLTEECIKISASLALRLNDNGIPFSLYTNGFVTGQHDNQVGPGRGAAHLARALEVLARVSAFTRIGIADLLRRFRWTINPNLTILLVTPRMDDDVNQSIDELARHGISTIVLLVRDTGEGDFEVATMQSGGGLR